MTGWMSRTDRFFVDAASILHPLAAAFSQDIDFLKRTLRFTAGAESSAMNHFHDIGTVRYQSAVLEMRSFARIRVTRTYGGRA
ncbi:hypothetical protein Sfum_3968 [Syntrophobacter fumaroxidans MPOB]|uniref:Uncharacterized protein n=1 Tax=Syntrophobacter fumaroxidans (strain DSM 10017 / MPOB) TaxID=335543 RepID=A0LQD3_SYNFM|nr:hypothetical protein Sfum_3968 [Syntrophobacter fumaroxidans MPOB]